MNGMLEDAEVTAKLKENGEDDLNGNSEAPINPSYGYGWRHIVTLLAFVGFAVVYVLRVNLSVALVAMVNHTALSLSNQKLHDMDEPENSSIQPAIRGQVCQQDNGNPGFRKSKEGPFEWDEPMQGIILASFFYGYIVTQIPGGLLAGIFGAKWVFGLGTLWTAVLTLLSPLAAQLGAGYLIALRVLEGLGEGITWPATQALFANWAPPSERSQLPSFASSGCLFGTIFAFMLSGILAQSDFLGGWPSIFYVFGFFGCVWFIFWAIFVESTPEKHRWISNEERKYIVHSLQCEGKRPSYSDIQWTEVMKSPPFWAAMVSHFTTNWCLYVLLTGLPTYFKEVLGFDTKSNGIASAVPYLCQGIVQILVGKAADLMRSRYKISTTTVRKIFDCSGHLLPAIFVVAVGYVGCDSTAALCLLTVAVSTSGFIAAGFSINFLDLAPQFSSVLFGISNTIATIPGIIGPSVTGALIKGAHGSNAIYAWRNVFFIAGGFYLFSAVFYFIFAKGDIQPWAKPKQNRSS